MSSPRVAIAAIAGLLAACAQAPVREAAPAPAVVAAPPVVLRNAGFEEEFPATLKCPPKWNCRVHADGRSYRFSSAAGATGGRSALIERTGIEHWATLEQSLPVAALRGQRLRFTLSMKLENIQSPGGGAFILVVGPSSYHEHKLDLRTGTTDWQRVALEVDVPAGADRVEVGATLEADGRIWIDDTQVEVLPKKGL